jgi:4-amino-4-deoxy-L-arabinose transferase-like glycosyltransferase
MKPVMLSRCGEASPQGRRWRFLTSARSVAPAPPRRERNDGSAWRATRPQTWALWAALARDGYALALAGLTLAGFGLRLALLARYPLREDEALYGYWALHALHEDPLFLHVWPDKPPLLLWLLAGLFALAGTGGAPGADAALARWLGIAAGTLLAPLAAVGARRLWGSPWAGLAAGLAWTLNPFAISFAPTVYTDPLLVLWGTLAVVLALPYAGRRPFWAGITLGAAIMTKQQGLLYLPLAVALLVLPAHPKRSGFSEKTWFLSAAGWGPAAQRLSRAALGLALVALPVVWWDSLRWAVAPSPWDRAMQTYAPLALAPPAAWGERVAAWGQLAWYLAASDAVWVLAAFAWARAGWVRRTQGFKPLPTYGPCHSERSEESLSARPHRGIPRQEPRNGRGMVTLLVFGWGASYLLLHALTTVQVWDRYLLPLAPLWAWALAWPVGHSRLGPESKGWPVAMLGAAVLAAALLFPAWTAAQGGFPVGADHGDYAGLDEALAWVNAQPHPQVLYHQQVGWQARFYLYDAVRRGATELRWFPSAVYLADNAAKTPYPRRYLVQPDWAGLPDLPLHLATRGLALRTRLHRGRVAVYEIVHLPQPACRWCLCTVP